MESIAYGMVKAIRATSLNSVVDQVVAELKREGFGVLCDIDVQATLQTKIGASFRPYRILGACNPHLAHQALQAEPHVGLLLPCNVVVQQQDDHTVVVSIIDPLAMGRITANDALAPLMEQARAKLTAVLDRLGGA